MSTTTHAVAAARAEPSPPPPVPRVPRSPGRPCGLGTAEVREVPGDPAVENPIPSVKEPPGPDAPPIPTAPGSAASACAIREDRKNHPAASCPGAFAALPCAAPVSAPSGSGGPAFGPKPASASRRRRVPATGSKPARRRRFHTFWERGHNCPGRARLPQRRARGYGAWRWIDGIDFKPGTRSREPPRAPPMPSGPLPQPANGHPARTDPEKQSFKTI